MNFLKVLILGSVIAVISTGCSSADQTSTNNSEALTIYTSIYPIQYAVEQIGGDSVSVNTVYPPGVDAHTYEPTSKDITSIAKSDAFIYLGAGMEGFAESAANALSSQDVQLLEIGENDELFHAEEVSDHKNGHDDDSDNHEDEHEDEQTDDEHNHGDHDPHIWLDPLRMIELAEMIKEELISLNPEEEAQYNENFTSLKSDLVILDESFAEIINMKNNKHILVSHAAYGYWEERYGIEQLAINGLSSSSEPSQKQLTEIIDQAREHNLDYIIFEQNSSNRVSEIIQDQIGAETLTIHNLSVLTKEDLEEEKDYMSLMNDNLEVLDKAMK
ncbi:zinc ABC transporter substrate-binding protein [Virgibacillus sp. C22-A2]|uniref:Zinc ABC transporter substrate-binding protein n=1 Tax=Virgibacillus tibetensis TaxID=3042313 RepID=A0ABU6KKM9_9BACI|nr:zinc ABC transporter substrate-binding protein [Virgibacillus sp. C22-A2]